jgi:hypothetical protein
MTKHSALSKPRTVDFFAACLGPSLSHGASIWTFPYTVMKGQAAFPPHQRVCVSSQPSPFVGRLSISTKTPPVDVLACSSGELVRREGALRGPRHRKGSHTDGRNGNILRDHDGVHDCMTELWKYASSYSKMFGTSNLN